MFIDQLKKEAKQRPVSIVFPESNDDRILEAVSIIARKGYAKPVLLGKPASIRRRMKKKGWSHEKIEIIDHETSGYRKSYAHAFAKMRIKKGMTVKKALHLLKQPNYFGCMMVKMDDAAGMITGAAHTTADSVRPALQIIKTKPGNKWVSGAFFVMHNDYCLLFVDCAIIEHPTSKQLAEIAMESAETFEFFKRKKARVALLSFSTKGSAAHESLLRIQRAVKIVRKKNPDLIIDGELQVDAALRKDVAKRKCPKSPIQGNANVLIFPDLNAGNISIKLLEILGGQMAVGPFLQSLAKPINDLSRGATVEHIVNLAVFTTVQVIRGYHERK